MNILFLMGRYPEVGGVGKITTDLANELASRGHKIAIASFDQPQPEAIDNGRLDPSIKLVYMQFPVDRRENLLTLRRAIEDHQTDIIINQWVVPWYVTKFIRKANRNRRARIIGVHHSLPTNNSIIQKYKIRIDRNIGNRLVNKFILKAVRTVSRWNLRKVYDHCDRFILLSETFRNDFARYIGVKNTDKVECIPNFITLTPTDTSNTSKINEIIYVGRIEYNSKRTFRVLEIWQRLQDKHPDWSLTFVGDGPDRNDLQQRIDTMHLQRVTVTGFTDPTKYYERAKILLLTSEYEGFGLVIVEGMAYGVVPAAVNSFSALSDLIPSDDYGVRLPHPFDADMSASLVSDLISDEKKLTRMSETVPSITAKFDKDKIVDRWEALLSDR